MKTTAVAWPGEAKRNQIAFCHDGVITVFGGTRSDDPRDFTPPAFAAGGYRIDIDSGAVTPVAAGPAPLMSVPSVVIEVDGRPTGLALGGIGHDGTRMDLSDRVWAYDFASDAWSDTELRLPSPRTLFGVTTYDGAVWCFGGWEMDRTRPAAGGPPLFFTDEVVRIDPSAGTVEVVDSLPRPRRSFGVAVRDGRAFLVGGLDPGFDYVLEADTFRFDDRTWGDMTPPLVTRAMADVVEFDGELVTAAGFVFGDVPDDGGLANPFFPALTVDAYDVAADDWREGPTLAHGEGGSGTRLFRDGDRLVTWSIDPAGPGRAWIHELASAESVTEREASDE
ncbi:MAG: hypothetical protein AAF532_11510 [Planctomycetota bacterium]